MRVQSRGGPAGDLYVRVHVKPHPVFGRSGDNLTVTVPATFAELALGAEIKVPAHGGAPVTVRIPAGTPNGRTFRVAGKGFVWSYPERRPGKPRLIRTDIAVLFVGDEAEKQALLLGEPEAFFTAPGYDGWPLVMLRLAQVDVARLKELVTDAWRMRAPDALVGDLDEADHVSDADHG